MVQHGVLFLYLQTTDHSILYSAMLFPQLLKISCADMGVLNLNQSIIPASCLADLIAYRKANIDTTDKQIVVLRTSEIRK